MKKHFAIIFVIILSIDVNAQINRSGTQNQYHIGLKEGVNFTQISGDGHAGFHKVGMSGGIFIRTRPKNKKFFIQLEALYSEKGSRWAAPPAADTSSHPSAYYEPPTIGYLLRIHYIEFPLLFQYNFAALGIKTLFFEGGLSYGRLIYREEYKAVPGYNLPQYGPLFKHYEVAYNLGVRYTLPEHFELNFRFSRSISAVRDYYLSGDTKTATFFHPGQQNTVLYLAISYYFDLAK